jgi:general secretion pathway protein C
MFARLSAFVIWSLVAGTAVFWAVRFTAHPPQAPAYAVAVGKATPMRGDLTRLFGAPVVVAALPDAAPESISRFKLFGVMAPRSGKSEPVAGYGLALIAVDGKPARAFAVGARLDHDLVLQSVSLRTASIGPAQGARSVLLELPALPPPTTGVLPAPGSPAAPGSIATLPAQPAARMLPAMVPNVAPAAPTPAVGVPLPAAMQSQMPAQPLVPAAPVTQPAPNPGLPAPDNFRSQ